MIIIIVITITIMIMMMRIILIIAAVIVITNSPFQLGDFLTGSTTGHNDINSLKGWFSMNQEIRSKDNCKYSFQK